MATFVLLHGAYLSGGCWQPLRCSLEALGHPTIAVDLPCDVPGSGIAEYATTAAAAVPDGGTTIVVGHSLGGLTAPVVAATRDVAALVLVAALVPEPGRSLDEIGEAEPDLFTGYEAAEPAIDHGDGSASLTVGRARELFWPDAPDDAATEAEAALRRQYWRVAQEPCPLAVWPDVPTTSIVCRRDRAVSWTWGARTARERLGIEPVVLDTDHSPMVSAPARLAAVLADVARGVA